MELSIFSRRIALYILVAGLLITKSWGQRGGAVVQQRLTDRAKYFPGTIQIAFNQPKYTPGDSAYFSLWFLDDQFRLRPGDHVIHLNLYDGAGRLRHHQKVKAKSGRCLNYLAIGKDLGPGYYKLTAFTPSMLKFNPQVYYEFWLVVEADKLLNPRPWFFDLPTRVFAEGHQLINQIPTRIFVTGVAGAEVLIARNGEPMDRFTLSDHGITSREVTPETGNRYQVIFAGSNEKFDLPIPVEDGVSVHAAGGKITLRVPTRSSFKKRPLGWLLINRGQVQESRPVEFSESENSLVLPISTTHSGLLEYYLVDEQGKPIIHRKLFQEYADTKFAVTLPAQVRQRDSLTIRVAAESNTLAGQSGNFFMSVTQQGLFDLPHFQSKFPQTPFVAVNAWLSEQSVRTSVTVNDVLAGYAEQFFLAEPSQFSGDLRNDLQLRGRVFSTITNGPAADSTLVLAFLQNNAVGYEAYTRDGQFDITSMLDFWGSESVFLTLKKKQQSLDATHRVVLDADTLRFVQRWTSSETTQPSKFGEHALFQRLVENSYQFFSSSATVVGAAPNPNQLLEEEFLEPDLTVDVEKYVVFPTMEDLIKEAVPFVQIRKRKNEKVVRLAYRTNNATRVSKGSPLLVMDGKLTFDMPYFLGLSPADVSFIKVLNDPNKLARLGRLGEFGIVFLQTKLGAGKRPVAKSHYLDIVGLTRPRDFHVSPIAANQKNPDFRSTLFWNGGIRLTAQQPGSVLKFRASDDLGPMRVVVAGYTDSGHWIYTTQTFEVLRKEY